MTLPVGTSATFTVSGTVPAGVTGPLTNTVTVTPPLGTTDPVLGNNQATDNNPAGPQADLAVTKVEQSQSVRAGNAVELQHGGEQRRAVERGQCAGAGRAAGAIGGIQLDLHRERGGGVVRHGNGAGDIDALVTLPVGTSATFTVTGTVPAGTTGALTNTATVTPPLGTTDPVPGNNSATDTNPAGPQADLVDDQDRAIRCRTSGHLSPTP